MPKVVMCVCVYIYICVYICTLRVFLSWVPANIALNLQFAIEISRVRIGFHVTSVLQRILLGCCLSSYRPYGIGNL